LISMEWDTIIAGGSAVFLGICGASALLTTRPQHFGSRGAAQGAASPEIRNVMKELEPIDSFYFDVSVARHMLKKSNPGAALEWLDDHHALGELRRAAGTGIISWQEGKDLEGKVGEISSLIREGRQKEAFGKLVDLQSASGELAYSAIAETIKEKGIDPPQVVMDSRFEPLREKKKAEWLAKGYSPGLVEKALLWAEDWSRGIAKRFVKDPGIAAVVAESIYPEALEMSEKWIKAFAS